MNPQAQTPSIEQACHKLTPSDFIVIENLHIDFSQTGEHYWLYLKKTNLNTGYVARLLADWASVKPSDVGYSGLKDRQAVTYQWFSIRLPQKQIPSQDFLDFVKPHLKDGEEISLEKTCWHNKKLSRGSHKTNRFSITLRQTQGKKDEINQQLKTLSSTGVPNYFGHQRFGHEQQNIQKAQEFFQNILKKNKPYRQNKRTAQRDSLLISTARSLLFNEMLAKRVLQGNWDQPLAGDVYNLNGSGSIFSSQIDETIYQRLTVADIHPVAPLYGIGPTKTEQDAQALYEQVLTQPKHEIFIKGLQAVGAKLSYRPTRLMVQDLTWQWLDDDLRLDFCLPRGSFATVVLDALVKNLN